ADATADGERAADVVGRRQAQGTQSGAVHHARSRRGDRAERPRGGDERGPGIEADRRVRDRSAAAARRRRGARGTALHRAAPRDLGRAARRGAARLSTTVAAQRVMAIWQTLKPRHGNLRWWQAAVLVIVFALWHVLTTPGL